MMNIEIKIPTLGWVLTFQKAPQLLHNHEFYFNPSSQTKFEHIWVSESCPGSGLDIQKTQTKLCKRTTLTKPAWTQDLNMRSGTSIPHPWIRKFADTIQMPPPGTTVVANKSKQPAIWSYWPLWKSMDSV
jgi:hypothetical protein